MAGSDEAVLRIVLEDAGTSGGSLPPAHGTTAPRAPATSTQQPVAPSPPPPRPQPPPAGTTPPPPPAPSPPPAGAGKRASRPWPALDPNKGLYPPEPKKPKLQPPYVEPPIPVGPEGDIRHSPDLDDLLGGVTPPPNPEFEKRWAEDAAKAEADRAKQGDLLSDFMTSGPVGNLPPEGLPPTISPPLDPKDRAKLERRSAVAGYHPDYMAKVAGGAPKAELMPSVEASYNPEGEDAFEPTKLPQSKVDSDRLEEHKKLNKIDRERAANLPVKLSWDPVKEARDRLQRDKERAQVDAEELRLKRDLGLLRQFDPREEARQRREAERRRAQVDAAYDEQFGERDPKSGLNSILQLAYQYRGAVGGLTGTIIEASLGALTAFRNAQAMAARGERQSDLLAEAAAPTDLAGTLPTALPAGSIPTALPAGSIPTVLAKVGKIVNDLDKLGKNGPTRGDILDWREGIPKGASAEFKSGGGIGAAAGDLLKAVGAAGGGGKSGGKPPTGGKGGGSGGGDDAAASGGMMASIQAVAPYVGIALAAKQIGEKINDNIKDSIKGTIGAVGGIANLAVSGDDPGALIGHLGDAASRAGEKIDEYVPVIGKLVMATGEAGKALGSFMQTVDQTVEKFGYYSPEIAQAQAVAEIRQTMGDLRRAQEGGMELARYVQMRSDVQQKFEDVKIQLLNRILEVVNPILDMMGKLMGDGKGIESAVNALAGPLTVLASMLSVIASLMPDPHDADVVDPTSLIIGPGGQAGPGLQL